MPFPGSAGRRPASKPHFEVSPTIIVSTKPFVTARLVAPQFARAEAGGAGEMPILFHTLTCALLWFARYLVRSNCTISPVPAPIKIQYKKMHAKTINGNSPNIKTDNLIAG
jgi:hypothetical protein